MAVLPESARAAGQTWVFLVSVLEWDDSKSYVAFPKDNRLDRHRRIRRLQPDGRRRSPPAGTACPDPRF